MGFTDGFLMFFLLGMHIPTRCCAFAVKTNINHSEFVFEIFRVCRLFFYAIQFSQEQFFSLAYAAEASS